MNELEKCLKAIANRSNLQEVGIVRSYPTEWDDASILPGSRKQPCKFFTIKAHQTNT